MDPTARFELLVATGCEPLDEAALAVAAHDHPVDVPGALARIDDLVAGFDGQTAADLCHHLFVAEGFSGDRDAYYDPANSFLDLVLERRRGIPLTLSILAVVAGRRARVPIVGVGMPGHFLVRDARDDSTFFDPFSQGMALDRDGCAQLLGRVAGRPAQLLAEHLAPVTARDIVVRMLTNLTGIYAQSSDQEHLDWVLRLAALLPGAPPLRRHAERLRAHLN